ncbi:hypothetical protein EMCRGX_G026660 [Ephydatia muelleri]
MSQTSSLEIESCLFALGVDDSIALSESNYVPSGDRIMGTGLGVLLFLGSSYAVPINIINTVSYRNQAGMGANFNFQETYESSIISLSNVSSTRGISPWIGGAFYYSVDHPALSYDTASSITFYGCNFSSGCLSGGSIDVQNVRSLQVIECRIFGQLNACCRNGTILVNSTILQTENCIGGIKMMYYNVGVSNCSFNGAGLISSRGTADVADSLFTNCQTTAISLLYSLLQLRDILYATTTLGQNNGNQSAMISSDATGVFHCVNDSAVFDTPLPISAYPGKKVNISIITIGQLHGASPDIVTYLTCLIPNTNANCTTPSLKTTDLQPTHLYCTNYTYLVTGNWNKTYSMLLNLILASAYLGKIDISPYQVTVNINQCPFGFRNWSDIMSICSAEDILVNYHIANDVQTSTVLRNNTIWIGNSSSNISLAVHLHCPYDYCNPSSITFRITDEQDNQCNYNRTGVLCGRCKPNMSSVFGSNRCLPCADKLWLLVPFSIMGVALVALLFLLNFTVSVGTINGLILYANIITPSIVNRFPFSYTRMFTFISWFNLDLGIETCFYNGMNTIVKTWLQFVFPAYILLLVGAFIFISRWSSLLTRLCRRNAVAVLATLILLSYTKILQTVITVFAFTEIDAGNSTANNPPVWLADGTVLYAQGEHAWLLVAGIIVTVAFLIPYTLILLLAPWIQAKSHWNVFSWINKLKPFLDAYQAPFKDQYCYWPGVLLMIDVVDLVDEVYEYLVSGKYGDAGLQGESE